MMLPGGPANKLGNRYETSWTISELVRMLHGETQAVHLEPPGANKVEFIVMKTGQCRELHQVKRSNFHGKWSFSDLRRDGLIRAIGDQLTGSDDRFVFASGSEARELAELCEAASEAESADRFEEFFLTTNDRCCRFRQLLCDWTCESRTAVDILRRIEVRTIGERDLELKIRYGVQALFLATPDDVIDAIRGIVEGSVYRKITRDALIEQLSRREYRLRRLPSVTHASAALKLTTDHYLDGTRSKLIHKTLVSTTAATELLSRLNGTPTETVLTGGAGSGKTACVFGVVEELRKRGMPVLAFRLDRLPPSVSTSKAIGDYLDMEESPILVLAAAVESVGRPGVLVIDQLDAVSALSGRNANALEMVEQLLHEARGCTRTPMHTVVVCRAFDWRHDSSLRRLFPDDHLQVDVAEFTNGDVEEILRKADFDPSLFQPSQLKLLRLPQNLSIFLEADVDASRPPTFNTRTKLFDAYWDAKRRSTATNDAGDHWMVVVTTLCDAMTDTQQLSVPRETLDGVSPVYLNRLGSEGVITFDGRRYGFGHESFFDYCFARLSMNRRQPLASLLKTSEQHLFRRSQVRQMLAYLRDARFHQYIQELSDLLSDQDIRSHIKDLAFNLLAEIPNPTDQEWMIWMTSIEPALKAVEQGKPNGDKLSALAWRHFFRSMSWFSFADQRDLIQRWLSSGNDGLADMAVDYLRAHHRSAPDRVAELLSPYVEAGGTWTNRYRSFMETTEHHTSRAHFDLLLRLVDNGAMDDMSRPFWQIIYGLDEKRPEWVPQIVARRLRRRVATIRASGYDLCGRELIGYDDIAVTIIRNAAKRAPAEFVEHVLPVILDISDSALIDDNRPKRDVVWSIITSPEDLTGEDACLSGSAAALEALARDATSDIGDLIDELRRRETYVANHLLLALYRGGAARYADDAASLMCNQPWRLKCGYADSPNWCSMELIRSVIKYCSTGSRRALEVMLLNYLSPFERSRDGQRYKLHGQTRFDLLSAIPKDLRSDQANRHFSELKRKFGQPAAEPQGGEGELVRSPIDKAAIPLMTDDQWLRAIKKYDTEHPRHTQDLSKGGAWELAGELNDQAKVEPDRFARLSLEFPSDANPVYLDRILAAIQDATLPTKLKLEVCRKAFDESRDHCSKSITDVLGSIKDPLPDDAVGMLAWLATEHDEPSKEGWHKSADNDTVYYNGDILTNGINSTRGRAAQAIHNLIVKDSAYVERFRPTIDRMIVDPSAAVISCVAGTVAAVAYRDPALGMTLFKSMNLSEDRLLATHYVWRFIGNNLSAYFTDLRPIIERMLRSAESEVCEAGGRLASLATLHHHHAADLVDEALRGSPKHRGGVAEVAATNVAHSECRAWCEAKLVKLFDDEDADVRRNAALCFSHVPDDVLHTYKGLISSFCRSKAFEGCSFWLVRALEKSRGRLPGLTCMVCERSLENPNRESMKVTELVFRTYQQHQSDEWTSPSLDLIDRLCLEGIIGTDDELDQFDR